MDHFVKNQGDTLNISLFMDSNTTRTTGIIKLLYYTYVGSELLMLCSIILIPSTRTPNTMKRVVAIRSSPSVARVHFICSSLYTTVTESVEVA